MSDQAATLITKEEALKIKNIRVAIEHLKKLNVDLKKEKIANVKEAIRCLCHALDKQNPEDSGRGDTTEKKPSRGLQKAIETDRRHREELLEKYEHVSQFYRQLPQSYQLDLDMAFPGLEKELERRKQELQTCECTILIVGETAAGKSSLINLLLGDVDLLPVSALSCTSAICEIRTSTDGRKEAIAYYRSIYDANGRKCRKRPPLRLDLSREPYRKQFQQFCKESDEYGDSPYERIELYYPFPMLEEGIVIVDTPGIGRAGNLSKYAERYLSKSYGLIYVINSANAGGVQRGRLQNFMRLVVNAAGDEGFSGDSTLFVCNRWEQVPDSDKTSVLQDITEKLSRFYKSLKPSQIHCMSIAEVKEYLHCRLEPSEYTKLLQLVEELLPNSLRIRLDTHYRWASAVLKRALFTLKVSRVMTAKDMEKAREGYTSLTKSLEKLKESSKCSRYKFDSLKSHVLEECENVAHMMLKAHQSKEFLIRVSDWKPEHCPQTEDRKKVVKGAIDCIINRVAQEINHWENEKQIVRTVRTKIINSFKHDLELLEDQEEQLEEALLDGDTQAVYDLHKAFNKPIPVRWPRKAPRESNASEDYYSGLGGAIVFDTSATEKQIKKVFRDFKQNDQKRCVEQMQEAAEIFLAEVFKMDSLKEKIIKFFSRFSKGIDAMAKKIPDFIDSDIQLIEILKKEMTGSEHRLRETFPKLIGDCQTLQGQMDLFYVNFILKFDYNLDELIWNHTEPRIGQGSFAEVFVARFKEVGSVEETPVALKVFMGPVRENNVTDILLEDRTLRELDHPNVIRYYGATYRVSKQRNLHWIMIMEICTCTLRERVLSTDVIQPGKTREDSTDHLNAMLFMARFAFQLCKGLRYLHEKGYVHRDLKMDNILVTDDDVVKLTDVGLTKPSVEIAYTKLGSPVYMAPEVLLQSQNYDHKADIYSLAIVLWEMWYGKDAATHIQQQLYSSLEKAIEDKLRPSISMCTKPNDAWLSVITRSWEHDPTERPNIQEHCKFFEDFINGHKQS